jgi:hypothetical protein
VSGTGALANVVGPAAVVAEAGEPTSDAAGAGPAVLSAAFAGGVLAEGLTLPAAAGVPMFAVSPWLGVPVFGLAFVFGLADMSFAGILGSAAAAAASGPQSRAAVAAAARLSLMVLPLRSGPRSVDAGLYAQQALRLQDSRVRDRNLALTD